MGRRSRKQTQVVNELVTVYGLSSRGHGVARGSDGKVVFVPGALPEEQCLVKRFVSDGNFDQSELIEIRQCSPNRTEPPCPHYKECGGCQLQHLLYEEQLRFKQETVRNALQRIGKLDDYEVLPTVPSPPLGYRNKLSLALERTEEGAGIGMRRQGSLDITPLTDCLIVNDRVRRTVIELTKRPELSVWFETVRIREIGESLVLLFEPKVQRVQQEALETAEQARQEVAADACFLSLEAGPVKVFGNECFPVGEAGCRTYCGPLNFLQVNNEVARKLFNTVLDSSWRGTGLAVDAYCGVGLLSFMLARLFDRVIGLEIDKTAVERATRSAREQGVANLDLYAEPLPEGLTVDKFGGRAPDLMVLDPPRTGVDPETRRRVIETGVRHLAMISCHPATLARDLAEMKEYRPVLIQPFDMFPQTFHVECLVVLERI